jgi:hypothetical protein
VAVTGYAIIVIEFAAILVIEEYRQPVRNLLRDLEDAEAFVGKVRHAT